MICLVRESEPVVFHRSSEKPKLYKCEQADCGKVFSDHASLKKHQLVHGEKLVIVMTASYL
jgi:Zinc finger, C2H2 type.